MKVMFVIPAKGGIAGLQVEPGGQRSRVKPGTTRAKGLGE
jgi:hypothetical protein